jgi:hypothetical protein
MIHFKQEIARENGMSVIDGLKFKLTCPECGGTESAYVADHGSGWSGSSWGSSPSFRTFEVTWQGGRPRGPRDRDRCLLKVRMSGESRSALRARLKNQSGISPSPSDACSADHSTSWRVAVPSSAVHTCTRNSDRTKATLPRSCRRKLPHGRAADTSPQVDPAAHPHSVTLRG